jgi:release factor glutamine methyltransferase
VSSVAARALTVQELLGKVTPWLAGKGVDSPKLDAEMLLAKALGIRRLDLYLQYDRPVTTAEQDTYRELVRRRSTGEPVAYLLGKKGFWKLELEVGPGVLIPRPETELLVELALARGGAPRGGDAGPLRILDVGTGSGCIAISLASELAESIVVALDKSPEALAIARKNADALCPGRVELRASDGFAAVAGETFDLVVSNPPYIASAEVPKLMRDVKDFEPGLALDGGVDGLAFLRDWSAGAKAHLVPGGWAFFEIGVGQGETAPAILREQGFSDVSVKPDLAGIPRVVSGRRS